jgi:putative NADH-flavin reductase
MNLIVFGATGKTGIETFHAALELGHCVTPFARDPAVFGFTQPRAIPIRGDVLNAIDVHAAISGQKAGIVSVDKNLCRVIAEGWT